MTDARFPIGTKFKTRGKHPKICQVTDIHKTYNNAGEMVKLRYVAVHEFCGQMIEDQDIVETTVAMGLISE